MLCAAVSDFVQKALNSLNNLFSRNNADLAAFFALCAARSTACEK